MDRITNDRVDSIYDGVYAYEDLYEAVYDGVYNGMPAAELGADGWRKPWSGGNGGSCVEAKKLNDGRVALRQSTDPQGPALIYTNHEISTFILGAKAGEADFLLS
jgi:hypothetical protein